MQVPPLILHINTCMRNNKLIKHRHRGQLPLAVERHPKDYKGYPFITLIYVRQRRIVYNNHHYLMLVDNYVDNEIRGYVLDLCGQEQVDETMILTTAFEWFYNNKDNWPLSIEFSKRNMTHESSKIYKVFHVNSISKVVGPVSVFRMHPNHYPRRQRAIFDANAVQQIYQFKGA